MLFFLRLGREAVVFSVGEILSLRCFLGAPEIFMASQNYLLKYFFPKSEITMKIVAKA